MYIPNLEMASSIGLIQVYTTMLRRAIFLRDFGIVWIQQAFIQTQTIANFFTIRKITLNYTSHYTKGDVQSLNLGFVKKFGTWNPEVATTYSTVFRT
jgi:hypothetical protein